MNNWKFAIDKLREIVRISTTVTSAGEKAGLYAASRTILNDLRTFVDEHCGSDAYAREKILKAEWHIGAALGFDIDNGHPADQHRVGVYGQLDSLESKIKERAGDRYTS